MIFHSVICSQMLVNLEGQVLVIDEAHNMEDASREAASIDVTNLQLTDDFISGWLKLLEFSSVHTCVFNLSVLSFLFLLLFRSVTLSTGWRRKWSLSPRPGLRRLVLFGAEKTSCPL